MAPQTDTAIALVPVRGGSRGLPGKNVRPLAGKPLYRHAVDQALRTVGQCIVSTDIEEILQADLPAGCSAVRRPDDLADDDTPMAPVILHALQSAGVDAGEVVLLQATSPLRTDADIADALRLHRARGFSLTMSVTQADRGVLKWGRIVEDRFEPLAGAESCFANRQSLPPVHRPNGAIYIFGAADYLAAQTFPTRSIGAYAMPHERSFDIDTMDDFEAVEQALARQA